MRKSGWDARRRNRNIGTVKSGYGQDNKLTIPMSWADSRLFHEKLNNPVVLSRTINGHELTFLIEATSPGNVHASTPEDITAVLELIPSEHLRDIQLIVLRQPKRKERIISSVWGRLVYWSEIQGYSGPAIHLDAQIPGSMMKWSKSLSPDQTIELNRLLEDGHQVKSDRRHYYITSSLDSIRDTQLYRTLPHEIGHYVDYIQSVEIPAGDDAEERERLNSLYRSKPTKDKEDFAHRYADESKSKWMERGLIPFPRKFNPNILKEEDLEPKWFNPGQ